MYWLDYAIIYFALGAPFGVLRITAKRMATPFTFVRSVAGYLLWPLVVVRNVARFLAEARTSVRASTPNASTTHNVSELQARHDLDALRTELEQALFADGNGSLESAATRRDLYAFREVFFRYTGLAEASAQFTVHNAHYRDANSQFSTLNSQLTRTACLARRDRQKLEAQLTQARSELNELLAPSKTATELARQFNSYDLVANGDEPIKPRVQP